MSPRVRALWLLLLVALLPLRGFASVAMPLWGESGMRTTLSVALTSALPPCHASADIALAGAAATSTQSLGHAGHASQAGHAPGAAHRGLPPWPQANDSDPDTPASPAAAACAGCALCHAGAMALQVWAWQAAAMPVAMPEATPVPAPRAPSPDGLFRPPRA